MKRREGFKKVLPSVVFKEGDITVRTFQNFEIKSSTVKSWQIGRAIVMAPSSDVAFKVLEDTYREAVGPKEHYDIRAITGPTVLLTERMGKISGSLQDLC